MFKVVFSPGIVSLFLTAILIVSLGVSEAQVMQSASYQIQSDSLNVGGNDTASSSSYGLRSTLGEVGTGVSDSTSYSINAGYRQMQAVYLALTGVSNVTLSPFIPGVTGGTANGSTTVTVTTDNSSGYVLNLKSDNTPAMQKGVDSIANLSPGSNPSFSFTATTGEAYFGYSPEGVDLVSRFKDNGVVCAIGSLDTSSACWDGVSTTAVSIASAATANHPSGSTTTVRFRIAVGASAGLPPGYYIATTTITALPQ